MLYRNFGKTGEKVSILGFGCMRLPILDDNPKKINEPLARRMLHYALDHGVNYVDTAYPYHGASATEGGMSEIFLGNTLKDDYREYVHLSTKLPSWLIQNKEDLNYYLDKQLQRLQTDQIDFYLLHGLGHSTWENLKNLDVLEFMDSAIDDGRIKYAGFSFHDELKLYKDIVDSYPWSFCQIQYNYMDQDFQAGRKGLEYAAGHDLGTVIMEPLRGGCLVKNIPQDIQAIWDGAPVKRTPIEWALRFLWDQSNVNMILSGMSTMEQVIENIQIAEEGTVNNLTPEERDLIQEVRKAYQARIHVSCTSCNYCMPCPESVDIPLNLNLLNDVYLYRNMEKPTGNYSFLNAKKQSASFCTECGECEDKCTQNLEIIKYLKETEKTLGKNKCKLSIGKGECLMKNDYHIDLEKYSLDKFKKDLGESELIPSRKILKEDISERFRVLKDNGIFNLQDLVNVLKTPKKAKEFAERSGLPQDYVLILRREVNSYTPKPVNLDKFPGLDANTIKKLNNEGIKNTAHLFKKIKTHEDRAKLAAELDISPAELLELTKLTDLVRIKWVGPIFARIFLDSGTDTSLKVSKSDSGPLYKKLIKINLEKGYTKGKFIESDVELCIKVADMVPKVIQF